MADTPPLVSVRDDGNADRAEPAGARGGDQQSAEERGVAKLLGGNAGELRGEVIV